MGHAQAPSPGTAVIVTRRLPDVTQAHMAELFDTRFNESDARLGRADLAAALQDCDVLVPTVTDDLDADLIAGAGERLQLIANYGAGVNHIALGAARARTSSSPTRRASLTEDTGHISLGASLSVPRRLAEGEKLVRSGAWTGWSPGSMLGRSIGGKALGIVGMGRIGQAVAARAAPSASPSIILNRHRLPAVLEAQLAATWHPDLDEMLATIDILTIHTPRNPQSEI